MLNPYPPSFQLYKYPRSPLTATVSTDPLQSNGTVTAKTDGPIFTVTRIAALALEWVIVDPGELLGGSPRHTGKPIRTQQWVEVASVNGGGPLSVSAGQSLLVEMQGVSPDSTPSGGITEHLNVKTGIPGDDFSVPLTLEVGQVLTVLEPAYDTITPMPITVGRTIIGGVTDWFIECSLGPPVSVSFRMDTFDTSGFITVTFASLSPGDPSSSLPVILKKGDINRIEFSLVVNTPGILAVNSKEIVYMWMTVTSQAGGGQTIQMLQIPVIIQ